MIPGKNRWAYRSKDRVKPPKGWLFLNTSIQPVSSVRSAKYFHGQILLHGPRFSGMSFTKLLRSMRDC